jgi:hypothetical protein
MSENPPVVRTPDPTHTEPRAMKPILKIAVPLVVLVGVVFGITYIMIYVPPDQKTDDGPTGDRPLIFPSATRFWQPGWATAPDDDEKGADPLNRLFPGFYEQGMKGKARFWFQNKNPQPVTIKLLHVSCASCSQGAIYIIPPETVRTTIHTSIVSGLPQGLFTGLPVGMVGPGALFDPARLRPEQAHEFRDPSAVVFKVPAEDNTDGWTPRWGILELGFEANTPPPDTRNIESIFECQIEGSTQVERNQFRIAFDVVEPFRMYPDFIDVGQIEESAKSVEREILVYSSTRPQPEKPFPPPGISAYPGGHVNDKFVVSGSPTPVPAEELDALSQRLTKESGRPVRVTGAYKVPVTVAAKIGDQRLDIGQLDQRLQVSIPGADPKFVTVRGTVRGGVWLSNGNAIDVGNFKSRDGMPLAKFELTTDRPGMDLVVVEGQQQPGFVQVTLVKKPDLGGRGYFDVQVHIPKNKQVGSIENGVIILEVKGPNPQRVRIPLKGRGDL